MMLRKQESQIHFSRYYRNGPVGSKSRVESASAIPMESYSIEGTTLRGVVTGTVLQNGDIESPRAAVRSHTHIVGTLPQVSM